MNRKESLREYLRSVARDLITRGIVRNHQGWTPAQILRQEPAAVFGSILHDLKDAGLSVGGEVVSGFANAVGSAVHGFLFGDRR